MYTDLLLCIWVRVEMNAPVRECVKVKYMRPAYSDLRAWLANDKNVLVCRRSRVLIDGQIFCYPDHPLANPYTVKEWGLDECLAQYAIYIKDFDREVLALSGKHIGCFCDLSDKCHCDVIIRRWHELNDPTPSPALRIRSVSPKAITHIEVPLMTIPVEPNEMYELRITELSL